MSHEVVRTRGGALAMRSADAGEVMHPGVGPLVEAQQLYVAQSRLAERLRDADRLVLFDVGLGAASNALAARAVSESATQGAAPLEIVSFERDLGALTLALSHGAAFGLVGEAADAARALLAAGRHETARTSWRLVQGDVLDGLAHEAARADVVFWDPFSPRANPELWTVRAFSAMRAAAGTRCTLFTYSASTTVRLALLLAGWAVGIGDAIGDKGATTVAAVRLDDLSRPLDGRWLDRLSRSGAPPPAHAPPDATKQAAAAPQFVDARRRTIAP